MRNRLEQLRKRQRDEALQAQEELLAGVAKTASSKPWVSTTVLETETLDQDMSGEEVEEYNRSMSPPLIDITKLSVEEREIDILTQEEDWRTIVSTPCKDYNRFLTCDCSSINAEQ